MPGVNDPGPVELLHHATCHGAPRLEHDRTAPFERLDGSNRPQPFKYYPDVPPVALGRELLRTRLPAVDALAGVSGEPTEPGWPLLGTLLFLAGGVTRTRHLAGHQVWYRTAMSAGNLHPIEIYLQYQGVWHYQPLEHTVVPLRPPPAGALGTGGPAVFVLTGIPFRTCWKYGERGWRHLFWDAGAVAANLMAASTAHGMPARLVAGFDDGAIAGLLGLDLSDELPVAMVVVGAGETAGDLTPAGPVEPITVRSSPVAPNPVRLPLLEEAHAASALGPADVASWREAAAAASTSMSPSGAVQAPGSDLSIEEVVLRRGSTRSFSTQPAPAALLEWALPMATRPVPSDFSEEGTLLRHCVAVHDVEGFEPEGPVEEIRAMSAALCLNQPLGGTSAYTVFHCAELDGLFRELGGRGYRAAQLEAGVVAQRLALCAVALGCGATGLTFFDGMVSEHFGTTASPMLATAAGVPAHPPVRGGMPGEPAVLRGKG
jgi:SagB-type dehydrogenase family enzyme